MMQNELATNGNETNEKAIVPTGRSPLESFLEFKFSQYENPKDFLNKRKKAKTKRRAARAARKVNRS